VSTPIFSADGHILEPIDLFLTRLPKSMRDRAIWEEDFESEPIGEEGTTLFRTFHGPRYDGHTYARYLHHDGSPSTGRPDRIIEDLDYDGIWAQLMHPNMGRWGCFTDDHEASIAHTRVYNDYVAETFGPYTDRLIPTFPVPLTDIADAVAEVDRIAGLGGQLVLLPGISPVPYHSRELDPVWSAIRANRQVVVFHIATGGVKVKEAPVGSGGFMMGNNPHSGELDERALSDRLYATAANLPLLPEQILAGLIGGGVPERYPELQFLFAEFGASWVYPAMSSMDKAWTRGVGQDRDWWVGQWDKNRPDDDQPGMTQLFHMNERWPYPLMPSEYVRRQFHFSFQEDPAAIALRHLTGVSTLMWACDYPHAEGTFRHSREAIAYQFQDVSQAERDAILGGTLSQVLGLRLPVA
jgi:predicted TIM-barrel fold metal-dependent hydrolase